jgi:hypothetical protein
MSETNATTTGIDTGVHRASRDVQADHADLRARGVDVDTDVRVPRPGREPPDHRRTGRLTMADTRVQLRNPDPTKKSPRMAKDQYDIVRATVRAVVPAREPGITLDDYLAAMRTRLPKARGWDGSASAGWWAMAIKLDLEARGELKRINTEPPQRLVQLVGKRGGFTAT